MDEFEKFYDKALRFLSFRPRSEKEVRNNLKKKLSKTKSASGGKDSEQIIELVIKKLKEQRFLNDREFAKWWIEQRTIVRPTGIRLIKIELKQKGIGEDLIKDLLSNSIVSTNELERAKRLVDKRMKKYVGLSRNKIFQKLGGFLSRRGFDYDTIKDALRDL